MGGFNSKYQIIKCSIIKCSNTQKEKKAVTEKSNNKMLECLKICCFCSSKPKAYEKKEEETANEELNTSINGLSALSTVSKEKETRTEKSNNKMLINTLDTIEAEIESNDDELETLVTEPKTINQEFNT